jgi:hypothetical protein
MAVNGRFSLPQQIEQQTRTLARTQEEASVLSLSLRAKDIIVRSGKAMEIETERDAWSLKYFFYFIITILYF